MAEYLSAGVYVTERDESTIVPNISNNVAFFAGEFSKGPVDQPYVITSHQGLIDVFGTPTDSNYNEWFQAARYFEYANQLVITRAFTENTQVLGEETVSDSPTMVAIYENFQETAGKGSFDIVIGLNEEQYKLPELEIGDLVTFNTTAQGDTRKALSKITKMSIPPNQQGTKRIINVEFVAFDVLPTIDKQGKLYCHSASYKNGETVAFQRGLTNLDVANEDFNLDSNGDPYTDKRLSNTYELIKNEEDFMYRKDTDSKLISFPEETASNGDTYTAKLKFYSKTPSAEVIEICIANEDDFEIIYDSEGNPSNKSVAFTRKNQDLIENVYLMDLFQYYPNKDEVAIVIKSGETVETFVVGFDPQGVDGNGKSNYIEEVINTNSKMVYVIDNQSLSDLPATYLLQDKNGNELNNLKVQGGRAPKITIGDIKTAYISVEDKEKYEIDVVIGNERNPSAAIDLADKRKDCIAFIGARYEDTVGKKANEATNAIIRYITEEDPLTRDTLGLGIKLNRTMFAAFFGNYFRIYDNFNKKYRWINVAGDMAGIRCSVTSANASWWVSAGMRRGRIRDIDRMAFTPSQEMRDNLYKNSINPLVTFPGTGHLVWGNKTMQSYASAFDRINVRNMFNTIERTMSKAARSQIFEFNDPYTRNAMLSMFNPYLASVKAGRGLVDYKVICDESNNTPDVISRNELRVDIYVKPNYSSEFIILNFVNVGTRSFASVVGA